MADAALLTQIRKWALSLPASLCASINPDVETRWVLRGASEQVCGEVSNYANLLCPGTVDALTSLLYRIAERSEYARKSEHVFKEQEGEIVIRSTRTTYRIDPLREALIEYCDYLSHEHESRQEKPRRTAPMQESEAVILNQRREAQQNIIAALRNLGIDRNQWPRCVQPPDWPENRQTFQLAAFQPPHFEGLHQSPDDWKRKATKAFEEYLDEQVRKLEFWIATNVEIGSGEAARFRGSGKTERNANIEERYKWAALRLSGLSWKEIAAHSKLGTSTVTKAASKVLGTAGWPTKLSAIKAGLAAPTRRKPAARHSHGQKRK
jgi:hypothetical protein